MIGLKLDTKALENLLKEDDGTIKLELQPADPEEKEGQDHPADTAASPAHRAAPRAVRAPVTVRLPDQAWPAVAVHQHEHATQPGVQKSRHRSR
jgi:hypothetical protein